MFERMRRLPVLVGIVVGGLLTTMIPEGYGHYIEVSGKLYYHSINFDGAVKQATDLTGGLAELTLVGAKIEAICKGPQGQIVLGTPSHPIVLANAVANIEQDVDRKGKATKGAQVGHIKGVKFLEWDPSVEGGATLDLTSEQVGCNRNWTLAVALLRLADIHAAFYDEVGTLATEAVISCVLPEVFTLQGYPLTHNLPTAGDEYVCTKTYEKHWD